MGRGGSIVRLALAVSVTFLLTGCWSAWKDAASDGVSLGDTPAVAGNTFDRYNDFSVIPPHSENLSISYRYQLESPPRGETVSGVNGPVWLYSERSAAVPESFFQIGLVSAAVDNPAGDDTVGDDKAGDASAAPASGEVPIVETVRLGSIRYRSTLFCVDPGNDALPSEVAGFVRNIAAHGYGLSGGLFIRHYEGERPGLDGRWLTMAFVLDITRMGYDCGMIGDPASPNDGYQDAVDDFKDAAARAFEVVR